MQARQHEQFLASMQRGEGYAMARATYCGERKCAAIA